MPRGRIIVVDDEPEMLALLEADLRGEGFDVVSTSDPNQALAGLANPELEVVLTDVRMPGKSGTELCREVVRRRPDVAVVLMTGFGSLELAVEVMRAGAYDFLTKPFEHERLVLCLDRAVEHARLRRELRTLRRRGASIPSRHGLTGDSPGVQRVIELIERIASSDAPVCIHGETGTGKELVARAIHTTSRRRAGPWVAFNCAAVPEQLVESELFGHAKGAFSGATQARAGLLRHAHGGTIFLDEVGDMPLSVQPKLLRALQEGRIRPVGSDHEIEVDVRILSATHKDLAQACREQRFREDLYFRLAVIRVDVPPLRERAGDIPLLARRFAEDLAPGGLETPPTFTRAAMEALVEYDWPGNVRELRNWIQHAVAVSPDGTIDLAHLPVGASLSSRPPPAETTDPDVEEMPSLAEVEREHILRVLEAARGNKTLAAKVLRIDRKTLNARLARYDDTTGE